MAAGRIRCSYEGSASATPGGTALTILADSAKVNRHLHGTACQDARRRGMLLSVTTSTATRAESVARIVRILLAARDQNAADIAASWGVNQSVVSRLLHGQRRWTIEDIDRVAEFFDVSPALFFDDPETIVRSRCSSLASFAPEPELDFAS